MPPEPVPTIKPALSPVVPLVTWRTLLPTIFPEGTPQRGYLTRDIAARTLFTLFYCGAIEGTGRWLRPNQVTVMTDTQANKIAATERLRWWKRSLEPGASRNVRGRWYEQNTREPIRDETLRNGLVLVGAVIERSDLPPTSSLPRYAVAAEFAELVSAVHVGRRNAQALVAEWRKKNLRPEALARIQLVRQAAVTSGGRNRMRVEFPNGETRLLHPGPSAVLTKAVIEIFAKRFLGNPGVMFVSESGNKVVARDEELAARIGMRFDVSGNLPDVILADTTPDQEKIVFVEIVVTDGPVTPARKRELAAIAAPSRFSDDAIYYVTAFPDRMHPAARRLLPELAWNTFAWFSSEPEGLLILQQSGHLALGRLIHPKE